MEAFNYLRPVLLWKSSQAPYSDAWVLFCSGGYFVALFQKFHTVAALHQKILESLAKKKKKKLTFPGGSALVIFL